MYSNRSPMPHQEALKISCSTCLRKLTYRGHGRSKIEAQDKAVDAALKVGWIMVGSEIFCPACVRAGRHIP